MYSLACLRNAGSYSAQSYCTGTLKITREINYQTPQDNHLRQTCHQIIIIYSRQPKNILSIPVFSVYHYPCTVLHGTCWPQGLLHPSSTSSFTLLLLLFPDFFSESQRFLLHPEFLVPKINFIFCTLSLYLCALPAARPLTGKLQQHTNTTLHDVCI